MALKKTGVQLIAQDATKFIGDLAGATNALKAFVGTAQSGASAIGASMGQAQRAMGAFSGAAQSMATSGAGVRPSLSAAQGSVTTFAGSVEKSSSAVSAASQVMIGALRKVGEMAVGALASATKAVAGFAKDSISLAGDFQQGMLDFQAAAGADVDTAGLEEFRSLFIQLGRDLPVSTSEVQQAAVELVKGGIDPAIIAAGGLKQNIQFAAAALKGDLVQAAEISSKVLGGWGANLTTAEEKTAFLTRATDLLTKAANASSVDVPELARGLYNVQGAAQAAGISFEDVTTVLAELAPRFASSAEAGTSLKAFIARIQPTTQPAIDAMKSIGLYTDEAGSAFYDAQGKFVGFQKASELLKNSLEGLTDEERSSILRTIFLDEAMSAASAMAQLGAKGYDDMAASLEKANGVAANAALKQQGFNTSLENAKGSIEALKITIGSALLPVLGNLLDKYIAPAINAVTNFADVLLRSNNPIATIAATIGNVIPGAMPLLRLIHNLTYAFTEMPNPIAGVGEALNILVEDIFGIKTNIGSLIVDGVQALTNAFSQNGLQGAILLFIDSFAQISPGFRLLLETTTAVMGPLQSIVATTFGIISSVINSNSAKMAGDVTTTWTKIQGIINAIIPPIRQIVTTIFGAIATFLENNSGDIQNFIKSTWNTIADIINVALDIINATIVPAFRSIAQFISDNSQNIQLILQGAWNIIKNTIEFALTIIKGLLTTFLQLIKGDWSGAWETIKKTAVSAWGNIKGVVQGAIQILQGILLAFWDALKKGFQVVWDAVKKIISDAWIAIKQNIATSIQNVITSISNATQPIQTAMSSVFNAAKAVWNKLTEWTTIGTSIIDGIISGIVKAAKNLASAAAQAGADAIAAAKKAIGFGSPAKKFIPLGESIPDGIAVGIRRKQGDLNELGQSILDGLVEGIESSVKSMEDAMQSLSDDIYDSFKDAIGAGSPAKEFVPLGQSIIQGVAQGAQGQSSFLKGTIDQIIDAASAFSSTGSAAKSRIEEALDIRKEEFKALDEEYQKYLEIQKQRELTTEEYQKWIDLAVKRLQLSNQITESEAAITEYQKKQNDLSFLRQQMDLVKFIQENKLNVQDILGGIQLGVNADPIKLLEAMNNATQQALNAMQAALGGGPISTGVTAASITAPVATPAQQIMMQQRPNAVTNYYGNVDYGSKVNMPIQSAQGASDIYQSLSLARIQAMMPA